MKSTGKVPAKYRQSTGKNTGISGQTGTSGTFAYIF
jgi:hypothetical protein